MQRFSRLFITVFTLLVMCTLAQAAEQKASGTYVYNSTAQTLVFTFTSSSFVCDGPPAGEVMSVTDVSVSDSVLNWTELWDGEPDLMTWSRVTGSGTSLIGKWQRSSNGGTKSIEFLNATQFEFIGADSSECPEGTGTHTASGTYNYDPSLSNFNFTFNVTASDFTCAGPTVGPDNFTASVPTATTMTWTWEGGAQSFLVREAGTPGSVLGTWESDEGDNTYTMTIDATTLTLVGQISNCDDGEADGAYIDTNHQLNAYWVDIRVVDSQGTVTGVTVVGPGISNPISLTYQMEETRWVSWINQNPAFRFDATPALPLVYTLSITRDGQSSPELKTLSVNSFLEDFAQPNVPAEDEELEQLQTFSWTGLGAGFNYSVQVLSENWQPLWEQYDISGDSIPYTGPVLDPGSYFYTLRANGNDGNSSTVNVSFTIVAKRGDLNGDGNTDLGDVITGLKVIAGNTPEGISTGGDVNGDQKIGIEEVIFGMQEAAE